LSGGRKVRSRSSYLGQLVMCLENFPTMLKKGLFIINDGRVGLLLVLIHVLKWRTGKRSLLIYDSKINKSLDGMGERVWVHQALVEERSLLNHFRNVSVLIKRFGEFLDDGLFG
jgi:hypothetical protein